MRNCRCIWNRLELRCIWKRLELERSTAHGLPRVSSNQHSQNGPVQGRHFVQDRTMLGDLARFASRREADAKRRAEVARRFVPIIVPLTSRGERRNITPGGSVETRISRVAAYVWRVTAMPVDRSSSPCQGLHNGTFLPYGSSHEAQLAAACPSIASEGPSPCCRPAGRTNARTADHAWAWLQEMDRLETARNRGEGPHHRLCGHHPGPPPQGLGSRRDPDGADRNTAAPHRARRALRGRRVLHTDLL